MKFAGKWMELEYSKWGNLEHVSYGLKVLVEAGWG